MSVRVTRRVDIPRAAVVVSRGRPLTTAERVGQHQPHPLAGCEHDVLDSAGEWFGTAANTAVGACFLSPPEMRGVRVMPPFRLRAEANSERLASSLGATLSHALLGVG